MRPIVCLILFLSSSVAQPVSPLRLTATVPLPRVQGRIDHMSIDIKGQRLFVAALENNTVEVIDIKTAKLAHTIPGLHEPQGIAYVPETNRMYVANGGDGSLRVFDGTTYRLLKTIPDHEDADNVRYDRGDRLVWFGYGSGALSAIDESGKQVVDIKLDAHPESFQLEMNGPRIFVNLPGSQKIDVIDRRSAKVIGSWTTGGPRSNFPMALDEKDHRLFVVCRSPARLVVLDTDNGKVIGGYSAVGDSDDVFYDSAKKRIYATGGEGAISVFQQLDPDHYREAAKMITRQGARTGFFSPDLERLFVAARRDGEHPAEIRIYEVQ